MAAAYEPPPPRWYGVPIRVGLITFLGTLLSFTVTLLFAIVGTVIVSAVRGVHPDMRVAYRHIAVPISIVAACIIFVLISILEVRHYRQTKSLSAIERMS